MARLTPLDTVPAFTDAIRAILADYWITSVEEFVSTARAGNVGFDSGLGALAQALALSEPVVRTLVHAGHAVLSPDATFSVASDLAVGTGAIFAGMAAPDAHVRDLPITDLPSHVALDTHLPAPASQGPRHTCVAFTLAAMVQHAANDGVPRSAQFLYWAAKQRDNLAGDAGTRPDIALQALAELGVCSDAAWAYDPLPHPAHPGHGPPPLAALSDAFACRVAGYTNLPPTHVARIKAVLASGTAVLVGLDARAHWTATWQGQTLGRIRKALPGEATLGGHTLLAVGYRDDAHVPGGGYLVARNSWGTGWGTANPDGAGYAHIPYRLIVEANHAAFAITGLVPADPPRTALILHGDTTTVAPAGPRTSTVHDLFQQAVQRSAQLARDVAALDAVLQQLGGLLEPPPRPGAPPAAAPAPGAPPVASRAPGVAGPLILRRGAVVPVDTPFVANGILATTGEPLVSIDAEQASALARAASPARKTDDPDYQLHASRTFHDQHNHYGTVLGDEDDLAQAGWAIVIHADDDTALLRQLTPLIVKRCVDQGLPVPMLTFRPDETCGAWLARHITDIDHPLASHIPVLVYHTGETAAQLLVRHGTMLAPVDPAQGVPFYLMLVGRPGPRTAGDPVYIPFDVQYELDIFWGVGRLCFTDPATGQHRFQAYRDYAERVVAVEQAAAPPYRKHIVYFGTRHDHDRATMRSADDLLLPLAAGAPGQLSLARRLGFTQELLLAEQATRANLDRVLHGGTDQGRPALLLTATHGMGFPADDPRLASQQGALLCQDWTGYGSVTRDHWFAADDLAAHSQVDGLIAVCFACYGMGSPAEDQFVFEPGRARLRIAPYPLVAQLPQRLLARGALAVLGHVDRAWAHSFSATGVPSQPQSFASVIGRLMKGSRLGFATDQFNMVQGAVAARLADLLEKIAFQYQATSHELSSLWVARNDARNYAVLGDPAVRLPFPVADGGTPPVPR